MNNKNLLIGCSAFAIGATLAFALKSRRTIPKGIMAIKPFDKDKYLGKWYEMARLDFRFEKNLSNTTAEYYVNDDGSIKVVNRGYNEEDNNVEEAIGKAKFVGLSDEAKLKVSFFGPFYAGYNVIAIDSDYKYALVAGKSLKFLWILSRKTTMPEKVKQAYLKKAESLGYDTSKLFWVKHGK